MRENIRALGVLMKQEVRIFGRTSDLLVCDDLRTFILLSVFHGFIERRVAEKSCLWLWWMRIIPTSRSLVRSLNTFAPDGRGDAYGEFQRGRRLCSEGMFTGFFISRRTFGGCVDGEKSPCCRFTRMILIFGGFFVI